MGIEDLVMAFEGAYNYLEHKRIYSEESFKVMRNYHDGSYKFQSESITRVANGELLKISVIFITNKEHIPEKVVIDRQLGSQHVQEIFVVNKKNQVLNYAFATDEETIELDISLPPKYTIATPAGCTAFSFFLTKKFDPNGNNFYTILTSKNQWTYKEEPKFERVTVEAPQAGQMNLKIDDKVLQCNNYHVYSDEDEERIRPVSFYISKHIGIPYRVLGPKQTKIEIKYLKQFEKDHLM